MSPEMEEQRLARIEAQQERIVVLLQSLAERVEDRIDATDEWRGQIERRLHGGNGSGDGLVVRLDRVEQALERGRWLTRAIGGAVVTLVVGAAFALLRR